MFKVILLIFISVYFIWNFFVQFINWYIPFKSAQTINLYAFYEEAIDAAIEKAKPKINLWQLHDWTIDVDYKWQTFENIEYKYKVVTDNDWNYQTWITIKSPWRINNKAWRELEVFIPIIEEQWELIFAENTPAINKFSFDFSSMPAAIKSMIEMFFWMFGWTWNKPLDNIYLNIWWKTFLQDETWLDVQPYAPTLNSTWSFYQQVLYNHINTNYLFWDLQPLDWLHWNEIFLNTWLSEDESIYPDEEFHNYEIEFHEEQITGWSTNINFWDIYEVHSVYDDECIEPNPTSLEDAISNAESWDTIVLCDGTFNLNSTIDIIWLKDFTIRSLTFDPTRVLIKNTAPWSAHKTEKYIFNVEDSNNFTLDWVTLEYTWEHWIMIDKETASFNIKNNIFNWYSWLYKTENSNKYYSNVEISWNAFYAPSYSPGPQSDVFVKVLLWNLNNSDDNKLLISWNKFVWNTSEDLTALDVDDIFVAHIEKNDFIDLDIWIVLKKVGDEYTPWSLIVDWNYQDWVNDLIVTDWHTETAYWWEVINENESSTSVYIPPVWKEEYTTLEWVWLEFWSLYIYKLKLDYQIYQWPNACFIDMTNKRLVRDTSTPASWNFFSFLVFDNDWTESTETLLWWQNVIVNKVTLEECTNWVQTWNWYIYFLR